VLCKPNPCATWTAGDEMNSDTADQLRQLYPDASDQAIEFQAHVISVMVREMAPEQFISDLIQRDPVEPVVSPLQMCVVHERSLELYGTFAVDGVDRCVQCQADFYLWLPRVKPDGLLDHPGILFDAEFDLGSSLAQYSEYQAKYPSTRLADVIVLIEDAIDASSDLRTESNGWLGLDDQDDYIPGGEA